jgi:TATA-binding protein-associated factor Taf7
LRALISPTRSDINPRIGFELLSETQLYVQANEKDENEKNEKDEDENDDDENNDDDDENDDENNNDDDDENDDEKNEKFFSKKKKSKLNKLSMLIQTNDLLKRR